MASAAVGSASSAASFSQSPHGYDQANHVALIGMWIVALSLSGMVTCRRAEHGRRAQAGEAGRGWVVSVYGHARSDAVQYVS